jgi:hypothetical protein
VVFNGESKLDTRRIAPNAIQESKTRGVRLNAARRNYLRGVLLSASTTGAASSASAPPSARGIRIAGRISALATDSSTRAASSTPATQHHVTELRGFKLLALLWFQRGCNGGKCFGVQHREIGLNLGDSVGLLAENLFIRLFRERCADEVPLRQTQLFFEGAHFVSALLARFRDQLTLLVIERQATAASAETALTSRTTGATRAAPFGRRIVLCIGYTGEQRAHRDERAESGR